MIPFNIDPMQYICLILAFIGFVISTILAALCGKNVIFGRELYTIVAVFLFFIFIGILAIIMTGTIYDANITICDKVTMDHSNEYVILSTDQQAYSIRGDPVLVMKTPVGKTISAHVFSEWGYQYPIIYAIDGPAPCRNSTCGV